MSNFRDRDAKKLDDKQALDEILSDFKPETKVVILIDGANVYHTAESLGFQIDYLALHKIFSSRCNLIRAYYYTPFKEEKNEIHAGTNTPRVPLQKLFDWMDYNKFTVVKKKVQEWVDPNSRLSKSKANLDVDICIGFVRSAKFAEHIILVSGDGDFVPMVEFGKEMGIKVSVISSLVSKPVVVSDQLRRVADNFIDLVDLQKYIERKKREPRRNTEEDDEVEEVLDTDLVIYSEDRRSA